MARSTSVLLAGLVLACGDAKSPKGPQLSLAEPVTLAAPAATELQPSVVIAVTDAKGLPLANRSVEFSIMEGGGLLMQPTAVMSDASGHVTAPKWRLGKHALPQVMRATLDGASLDIDATVQTKFNIDVRFRTQLPAAERQYFTRAAARIMAVITGDVENMPAANLSMSNCAEGAPNFNEPVDDVVIFVTVAPIDGPGGIEAWARACWLRSATLQPVISRITIDSADWPRVIADNDAEGLIVHEMLHSVGFGPLWPLLFLVDGGGTIDPRFIGGGGREACPSVAGTAVCATGVPVEGSLGSAASEGHWRESTFGEEVMTGWGPSLSFSLVTVRSLEDLRYTVNTAAADDLVLINIPLGGAGTSRSSARDSVDWSRARLVDRRGTVSELVKRK